MADEVKQEAEIKSECNGFGKAWEPTEEDCKECKDKFPAEYNKCKDLVVNQVKEMRQEAGQFASTAVIDNSKEKENSVDESTKETKETKKGSKKASTPKEPKPKKERKNGLPGVNVRDAVRAMIKEGKDVTTVKGAVVKMYVDAGKKEEFAKKRAKTVYSSVMRQLKREKDTPAKETPAESPAPAPAPTN